MPLLLFTYLATEIAGPFLASLLIINSILFLSKLSSFMEVIFNFAVGPADLARITAYLMPNLLLYSIPMASTIGVIVAFSRLAADNEIMALKAAGIGLYRMLPPVVVFALATSSLAAISSCLMMPRGSAAMQATLYQLAREKLDRGLKEKSFSNFIKDIVIYADRVDSETGRWRGVYISDLRRPNHPVTVLAESGQLKARPAEMLFTLTLENGSVHRRRDGADQTIEFDQYQLSLPALSGSGSSRNHPEQLKGKNELATGALLIEAAKLEAELAQTGQTPDRQRTITRLKDMLIEFHTRLVFPTGCFIMTLLALPLALQNRPGRRAVGLPLGLGAFILYYIFQSLAKSTAETSSLPVGLILWVPNLLFAGLTIFLIRAAAREHVSALPAKVIELFESTMSIFKKPGSGG